jgi:PAS domain S-box-containing protein/putative nucleotidyltransferase with HDIG domain
MLWQWSPGVIAELVLSAILLVLAIYFPWRDLDRQGRLTGTTLIFTCALWVLAHALEIGLPVVSYKEPLLGAQLVLGLISITLWLFYILHYFGPRILLSLHIYLLFGIIPLIAIAGSLTNYVHGLMWTDVGLDAQNPYLPLQPAYGPVYWACMIYSALLTITGSFIIIKNLISYTYSSKSIYLLVAAVITVVSAFVEVMGLLSYLKFPLGLTPWIASAASVILVFNLPRFHLDRIIPAIRDITFERAEDCILVLDTHNCVLDLNPAAEQLIGCRVSDAVGLPIQQLWPYQSSKITAFNKMINASEELVLEIDGKLKAYDLHISMINDSGGLLTSKVVLLTDITERKQAEKTLRESEAQYRLLAENMRDTVWMMDMDLKTHYQSPSVQRTRGYTPGEISEMPLEKHLTPASLKLAMEVFAEELAKIEADPSYNFQRILDLEFYCKNGKTMWAENTFSLLRDENGKPASILCEGRDVTDRKLSEDKLLQSYENLKKTLNDAINTMVKIVELRDPYTAGHQQRVSQLVTAIARQMKLEETVIEQLKTAALIHDIGKINIPSDILSKPGRLSDIEFDLIKTHSQHGYDIVKSMDFPYSISQAILQHHERLDGSGYPHNLNGGDMLLESKILAVADVVEAMASHRPYRPTLGIDKALDEISKNKGKLYDINVVDACLTLFYDINFEFK